MKGGRSQRGAQRSSPVRYSRMARVNESLREVLAEEIERLEDVEEGLGMLTVTAVDCDPDLRHAKVLFASLDPSSQEVLAQSRVRLQAAISSQVRMKRTPQLSFAADPSIAAGQRVEDLLKQVMQDNQPEESSSQSDSASSSVEHPSDERRTEADS